MGDTFNAAEFEAELAGFQGPPQQAAPGPLPQHTYQQPQQFSPPPVYPSQYNPPVQQYAPPQPMAPSQPYQGQGRSYPQGQGNFAANPNRPPQHAKMWLYRNNKTGQMGKSFSLTPEGIDFLRQELPNLGNNRISFSFVEYTRAMDMFNATGRTDGPAGSGTFKVKPPSQPYQPR